MPCSIVLPVDDVSPEILMATLEAISVSSSPELYEVLVVNCAMRKETQTILAALGGDVKIIDGEPHEGYGAACNKAVGQASGKYLAFLKPGLIPEAGWLEGLLAVAEQECDIGVIGGRVLNVNGLLWHIGVSFDVNQSPFSIYRLLPREFSGALKQREFNAVEFPFLISRDLFCRLGGFDSVLRNRFEDVDLCLAVRKEGFRVLYTPRSTATFQSSSWKAEPEQDQSNRIHFYSKWTGFLWQNDEEYLRQDGLTHDSLSALYRELAGRLMVGAEQVKPQAAAAL